MRKLEYPVLGVPVEFESDSEDILEIVEDAFGGWDCLDLRDRLSADPMLVKFMIGDGDEGAPGPTGHVRVRHFFPDADRVVASSPGSFGMSDPFRRETVAFVSEAMVADREHFRETFLEALTFALLSAFDRHPLHAAAVASGGHAVLLAGPSGSGKSSLAMVARTAGLDVLGDDHVWIQTTPKFRVWGAPRHIRLVSNAPSEDPRGKAVIRLDDARRNPAFYRADSATVCLLSRENTASLSRIDDTAIAGALHGRVDPGFDRFPDRHRQIVDELAAGGGWRLTLSENPDDALPFLRSMLEQR
jgi:hypothetical protein